jgi:hypothetical protein
MQFLMDLYAGVRRAVARGEKPGQIYLDLPASDRNWIPNSLQQDVEVTYREITEHQPAGALPHVWK